MASRVTTILHHLKPTTNDINCAYAQHISSADDTLKKYILKSRPKKGQKDLSTCFQLVEQKLEPSLRNGEVLIKVCYFSTDATQRNLMNEDVSYMTPLKLGDVMGGLGGGQVIASKDASLKVGDFVTFFATWQTHLTLPAAAVNKVPDGIDLATWLSVGNMTGLTAAYGLKDVGKAKEGETLVVSAASGATGLAVGQIGKIIGMRVIGITGSDKKCKLLTEKYGFDGAVNYKTDGLADQIKSLCPKGVDVFFDNVGGHILEAVLSNINSFARIPLCGQVSSYFNDVLGPNNLFELVAKQATMRGFLLFELYQNPTLMAERVQELCKWISEDKLRPEITFLEGFESVSESIQKLGESDKTGKLLTRVVAM